MACTLVLTHKTNPWHYALNYSQQSDRVFSPHCRADCSHTHVENHRIICMPSAFTYRKLTSTGSCSRNVLASSDTMSYWEIASAVSSASRVPGPAPPRALPRPLRGLTLSVAQTPPTPRPPRQIGRRNKYSLIVLGRTVAAAALKLPELGIISTLNQPGAP